MREKRVIDFIMKINSLECFKPLHKNQSLNFFPESRPRLCHLLFRFMHSATCIFHTTTFLVLQTFPWKREWKYTCESNKRKKNQPNRFYNTKVVHSIFLQQKTDGPSQLEGFKNTANGLLHFISSEQVKKRNKKDDNKYPRHKPIVKLSINKNAVKFGDPIHCNRSCLISLQLNISWACITSVKWLTFLREKNQGKKILFYLPMCIIIAFSRANNKTKGK